MIFLNCIKEDLVQVGDMIRIDVSKSFVSGDELSDILIKPESSESFISVYNLDQDKWYLDWAYSTEGNKTISVQATDGTNTVTQNFTVEAITEENDYLYSNDSDLFAIENELKMYIPRGRNSFTYAHREAQSRILSYLDRKRIWNDNGDVITKTQVQIEDMKKWSLYETAVIIYTDLFVSVGDKFAEKINQYRALRDIEKERGAIRLDKDNSGTIDSSSEIQDLKSFRLIRR